MVLPRGGRTECTPGHTTSLTLITLQATAVGVKETEATNFLEKKFKANPAFTFDEAVQTAISALQGVLSEEFKSSDLEVRHEHPLPASTRACGTASQAGGRPTR